MQHLRALGRNAEASRCPVLIALKAMLKFPSRCPTSYGGSSASLGCLTGGSPSSAPSPSTALVEVCETPPPLLKKSRTNHLQSPPTPVDVDVLESAAVHIPMVTAAMQSAVTNPAAAGKGFNLESLPLHEGRVVPPNFSMELHQIYLRLPECVMPADGAKLTGKSNYTITSSEKSAVQVQLSNKCFFIVRIAGAPWPKTSGSPNVAWARFSSIEEAWAHTVEKVGGWTK